MNIAVGADHAGYELKKVIIDFLKDKGHKVEDFGCYSEESIDYPDYAHPVAEHVENNPGTLGILLCGSGNGINMTANKHQGIRAALCWNKEIVFLARSHNDANILSIPARFVCLPQAIEMVVTFLETPFEGGRHSQRINKIPKIL